MEKIQRIEEVAATDAANEALWRPVDTALVVDGASRIVWCGPAAAALLGWSGDDLSGRVVTEVMPELPFAVATPGYNLAYAAFNGTPGAWIRRNALSLDGAPVPVDVALSRVRLDGSWCIELKLRQPLSLAPNFVPSLAGGNALPAALV